MLTHFIEINWLGVLAGTAVFAVLGYLWFAVLFPRAYRAALGRTDAPAQGALDYAGPLVAGLVMVLTTALLQRALGIEDVASALVLGLVIAVGYLAPMTVTIAINPNFPHPLRCALVNVPYFAIAITVASVLLAVIR